VLIGMMMMRRRRRKRIVIEGMLAIMMIMKR
jgi:hypothetical protein